MIHVQGGCRCGHRAAKVPEFEDALAVDQDVGWLHVQVDDPLAVAVTQGRAHVLGGAQQEAGVQWLVPGLDQEAVEIPAANILHDHESVPEITDDNVISG